MLLGFFGAMMAVDAQFGIPGWILFLRAISPVVRKNFQKGEMTLPEIVASFKRHPFHVVIGGGFISYSVVLALIFLTVGSYESLIDVFA